ncbi:MAG: hypothetical protein ACM3II_07205 [Rhodospirillaceae bacterium]
MRRPQTTGGWIVATLAVIVGIWLVFVLIALLASKSSGADIRCWDKTGHEQRLCEQATETAPAPSPPSASTPPSSEGPNPEAVAAAEAASVEATSEEEGATASASRKPRRRHKAQVYFSGNGQRCFKGHTSRLKWKVAGGTIGELKVRQYGWCVNDKAKIVKDLGWAHSSGSWGPYCITNDDWERGWMVYPGSKFGRYHASLGVDYPLGCFAVRSGTASLRIFGNGWWDTKEPI